MPSVYFKAGLLGIVAGMRTMMAPAAVAIHLTRHNSDSLVSSPFSWMEQPLSAEILSVMSAAELIVDKLPATPARTASGPLVARVVSGTLSGATLCVADSEDLISGAFLGAVGGLIGAHLGYRLRRWITTATPLPDPVVALVEDALAFGLARWALSDE